MINRIGRGPMSNLATENMRRAQRVRRDAEAQGKAAPDDPDKLMKLARCDAIGEIRFMAFASGWVMVRRPGCIPWTEGRREWLERPLFSSPRNRKRDLP